MQTIDGIRRTNELSKVLKNHGLVEDSFSGAQAAEEITGANIPHENDPQVTQKLANLERSKHLLSQRVDSLQQELGAANEALRAVISRLDGAEAKLRVLRQQPAAATESVVVSAQPQAPAQPVQELAPMQEPAAQQAPAQQQPAAPAAEKPRHPRQAAMSDEYSIENVFYCGTR